ncbi:MAG TPA: lysylphosphatidylglycerol synthase transmembrane domain-containing protein [Candidatus Limiplasma sp.]|nr:lysylphosphatidylglycerol synthase transmembrane domain-containing protein [Candidatus Limiplasma sp.]
MKRTVDWKKWISLALFAVMAALLVWYVKTHWTEISGLLTLNQTTVGLLLGLGILGAIINSVYHLVILRTFGIRMKLTDWMGVTCVSNAIAFVMPLRGELALAAGYYKRVNGLAYTKSAAMVAGNMVFGVSFSLLQIIAAMLCVGLIDGKWPLLIWGIAALGMLGIAAFVIISLGSENRLRRKIEKWKIIRDIITGFNDLLRSRRLLWQLLGCMTGSNIVRLLIIMVCFQASGSPISFYEALLYGSLAWLASVIAVVPGNIGLKESVMGIATMQLGVDFTVGVTASLLERVTTMVVYIGLGLVFALPVWLRYAHAEKKQAG